MKIKVDVQLVDLDGDQIKDEQEEGWTLGKLMCNTLVSVLPEDKELSPSKSVKRWKLALKIREGLDNGEEVEVDVDDLSLIRKRAAKMYSPMLAGQACEMLNGPKEPAKDD